VSHRRGRKGNQCDVVLLVKETRPALRCRFQDLRNPVRHTQLQVSTQTILINRLGNATPAWLANDLSASRRHALIVAQVIKLVSL
jgi:hypothetical protein